MLFTDTVMAGRLGAHELAAVAVGANYVGIFYLGGLGLLMAMSPTVAHAYGAGRDEEVGTFFRQALWLSLAVSAVACAGLSVAGPALPPDRHSARRRATGYGIRPRRRVRHARPVRVPRAALFERRARLDPSDSLHGDDRARHEGARQLHAHLRQLRSAAPGRRGCGRRHGDRRLDHFRHSCGSTYAGTGSIGRTRRCGGSSRPTSSGSPRSCDSRCRSRAACSRKARSSRRPR